MVFRVSIKRKPLSDLLSSKFALLSHNFTNTSCQLPVTPKDPYNSSILHTEKPFKYVRFSVNETNTGTVFWGMSEFKFYSVKVIDPEAVEE